LKASAALKRGGIHTFEQLASLDAEHIKAILGAYGLRSLDPTTWPEQAANAAKSS
jgi:predicted flap endonuclease-1-like 5' DNA nuclease